MSVIGGVNGLSDNQESNDIVFTRARPGNYEVSCGRRLKLKRLFSLHEKLLHPRPWPTFCLKNLMVHAALQISHSWSCHHDRDNPPPLTNLACMDCTQRQMNIVIFCSNHLWLQSPFLRFYFGWPGVTPKTSEGLEVDSQGENNAPVQRRWQLDKQICPGLSLPPTALEVCSKRVSTPPGVV